MEFKVKKGSPGLYQIMVNNYHRFDIRKKEKPGLSGTPWEWVIKDRVNRKNYIDFVSLAEAKKFIKDEILKSF